MTDKNVIDLSSKTTEIASALLSVIKSIPIVPASTAPIPPGVGTTLNKA